MESSSFVKHPIIFGDFMKMGAAPQDKMYEELADLDKVSAVLQDVSMSPHFTKISRKYSLF